MWSWRSRGRKSLADDVTADQDTCPHSPDHPAWCDCDSVQATQDKVDRYGWIVVEVPEDDINPQDFVYTVGLTGQDLPEIIAYGLAGRVGYEIMNSLAQRLVDGTRYMPGEPIPGLLEGNRTPQLHPTVRLTDPLGAAWDLYRERMSAVQLVWPDADNRMPWEDGFAERVAQPVLYRWGPA